MSTPSEKNYRTWVFYWASRPLPTTVARQKSRPPPASPPPAPSNPFECRGNKGRASRLQVRTCLPTGSAFWPRVFHKKARSGCGLVSANKNVWWEQTLSVHWVGENKTCTVKLSSEENWRWCFVGGKILFTEMIDFSCWRWNFSPARMISQND